MIGSPYPQPQVSPFSVPGVKTPLTVSHQPATTPSPTPAEASLPRYVNYLADYSGCGHWRILWPEGVINMRGDGMSQSTTAMITDPKWYTGVKCVKLQRQASSQQKEFVSEMMVLCTVLKTENSRT